MSRSLCLASLAPMAMALLLPSQAKPEPTLNDVDLTKSQGQGPSRRHYRLSKGSAGPFDSFFRKLRIDGTTASIHLRNDTDKELRPAYEVKVFDRFGLLIGEVDVKWSWDTVEAKKDWNGKERLSSSLLDDILAHSTVAKAPGIGKPAWLQIQSEMRSLPLQAASTSGDANADDSNSTTAERVVWKETPTHKIKIKFRGSKEIGRWEFAKAAASPSDPVDWSSVFTDWKKHETSYPGCPRFGVYLKTKISASQGEVKKAIQAFHEYFLTKHPARVISYYSTGYGPASTQHRIRERLIGHWTGASGQMSCDDTSPRQFHWDTAVDAEAASIWDQ